MKRASRAINLHKHPVFVGTSKLICRLTRGEKKVHNFRLFILSLAGLPPPSQNTHKSVYLGNLFSYWCHPPPQLPLDMNQRQRRRPLSAKCLIQLTKLDKPSYSGVFPERGKNNFLATSLIIVQEWISERSTLSSERRSFGFRGRNRGVWYVVWSRRRLAGIYFYCHKLGGKEKWVERGWRTVMNILWVFCDGK